LFNKKLTNLEKEEKRKPPTKRELQQQQYSMPDPNRVKPVILNYQKVKPVLEFDETLKVEGTFLVFFGC
jgi:hypothetical protein